MNQEYEKNRRDFRFVVLATFLCWIIISVLVIISALSVWLGWIAGAFINYVFFRQAFDHPMDPRVSKLVDEHLSDSRVRMVVFYGVPWFWPAFFIYYVLWFTKESALFIVKEIISIIRQ